MAEINLDLKATLEVNMSFLVEYLGNNPKSKTNFLIPLCKAVIISELCYIYPQVMKAYVMPKYMLWMLKYVEEPEKRERIKGLKVIWKRTRSHMNPVLCSLFNEVGHASHNTLQT